MREKKDLKLVKPSDETRKLEDAISKLDELIELVEELDPLSGNLLVTTKTLLWGKLHLQGHPCGSCVVSREVKRLCGN